MTTLLAGSTNTTFAHEYTLPEGAILAAQFTAGAKGMATELQIHTGSGLSATQLAVGIYTDTGGTPGELLGGGATFPKVIKGHQWQSVTGLGIPLEAATNYWIAVLPVNGSVNVQITALSGGTPIRPAVAENFTRLPEKTTWTPDENDGPIGFQVLGVEVASIPTRLKEKFQPWNTGEKVSGKTDLDLYLEAIASIFEPVLDVAEESGTQGEAGWVPGYGVIFNPTTCPARFLPWIAQFVGVEIPKTATEAEARAMVEAEAGLQRGTLASVEMAIERVLGKGEHFQVRERTGPSGEAEKPYHFLVYVPTGKASAALNQAIEEKKPGGVMFTVTEVTNTWLNGVKKHWSEVTVKTASEMVEPNY